MRLWSGSLENESSDLDISEDTKWWNLVFRYLDKIFLVDF